MEKICHVLCSNGRKLLLIMCLFIFMIIFNFIHILPSKLSQEGKHIFTNPCEKLPKRRYCRLPHVVVVGPQKAGTKTLSTFLNLHPNIYYAKGEMEFFSGKYIPGTIDFR